MQSNKTPQLGDVSFVPMLGSKGTPNCPHKDQCNAKIFKKVAKVLVTKKSLVRLSLEKRLTEEAYDLYRRIRNGVETIPSILRRNNHLEKLARGKQRGEFFFGSKIVALNFRKLFRFRIGSANYAPKSTADINE